MLAIVKEMIETAIGVHEEKCTKKIPPSSREMGNTTMADHEITIKLRDAETKLATLMSDLQARDTEVARIQTHLKDRDATIASQMSSWPRFATTTRSVRKPTRRWRRHGLRDLQRREKLTDLDKEQNASHVSHGIAAVQ